MPTLGDVSHNGNGNSVQSVVYRSSGVIIDLTPEVREDSINLSILHHISSFTNTTTGVNSSSGDKTEILLFLYIKRIF